MEEEAADTSKMLAHTYKTIRCHIPDQHPFRESRSILNTQLYLHYCDLRPQQRYSEELAM